MSTHSYIGVIEEDGTLKYVYCHSDGTALCRQNDKISVNCVKAVCYGSQTFWNEK